jgi:hypothetical protein
VSELVSECVSVCFRENVCVLYFQRPCGGCWVCCVRLVLCAVSCGFAVFAVCASYECLYRWFCAAPLKCSMRATSVYIARCVLRVLISLDACYECLYRSMRATIAYIAGCELRVLISLGACYECLYRWVRATSAYIAGCVLRLLISLGACYDCLYRWFCEAPLESLGACAERCGSRTTCQRLFRLQVRGNHKSSKAGTVSLQRRKP